MQKSSLVCFLILVGIKGIINSHLALGRKLKKCQHPFPPPKRASILVIPEKVIRFITIYGMESKEIFLDYSWQDACRHWHRVKTFSFFEAYVYLLVTSLS